MKVAEFPTANLTDIPAMLRKCANDIEAGDHEALRFVVLTMVRNSDLAVSLFLFGKGTPLEVLGALSASHHQIIP